jgi:hypothetical protein
VDATVTPALDNDQMTGLQDALPAFIVVRRGDT